MPQKPKRTLADADKGSDPKSPTFNDWQAKELIREGKKTSVRKQARKLRREERAEDRKARRRSGRR
jgi:hypothetical protein